MYCNDVIHTTKPMAMLVSIITELQNYPHILEKIFANLRPKDLRTISCVCRHWHDILRNQTPKANRRRSKSIEKLRKFKQIKGEENWPIDMKCARLKRKLRNERQALSSIQNLQSSSSSSTSDNRLSFLSQNSSAMTKNNDNDEVRSKPKRKRKRWTLAQVPFKSW